MLMEVAEIQIKPGNEALFEAAVQKAVYLFQRAKGCRKMHLERSVEQTSHFTLRVEWDTLEDHMVHFRESADFQEWRALVGEHFAAPPNVGHTTKVVNGF